MAGREGWRRAEVGIRADSSLPAAWEGVGAEVVGVHWASCKDMGSERWAEHQKGWVGVVVESLAPLEESPGAGTGHY